MRRGMLAEVPTHEDQARKWVSTWSEERCIVRHRWISQDGKACLLASWFLSRDVAVHSGVVGASAPAPRCFKFRRKTRPGDPGGTTTADATVWQKPKPSCSPAGARPRGGLYVYVVCIQNQTPEGVRFRRIKQARSTDHISVYNKLDRALGLQLGFAAPTARPARCR